MVAGKSWWPLEPTLCRTVPPLPPVVDCALCSLSLSFVLCVGGLGGGGGLTVALPCYAVSNGPVAEIRVHARHLGHPLVGDATYGGIQVCCGPQTPARRKFFAELFGETLTRPALHAASLAIDHPVTLERIAVRSPIPADMAAAITLLGGDPAAIDAELEDHLAPAPAPPSLELAAKTLDRLALHSEQPTLASSLIQAVPVSVAQPSSEQPQQPVVPPTVQIPARVRSGQMIPYTTFVATAAADSSIQNAGTGLFAAEALPQFTWIGLYPGKVTARRNGKRADHTMGSIDDMYIIAEEEVKTGVHMANEASAPHAANVWYLKLDNGYCLYFAGEHVDSGAELLTCYSRSYGKRCYPVPKQCSDPRCAGAKHRTASGLKHAPKEWRAALTASTPASISKAFLKAAGLRKSLR